MIHIDSWSKYQSSGIIVRQNWSPLLLNARCCSSQIKKDLAGAKKTEIKRANAASLFFVRVYLRSWSLRYASSSFHWSISSLMHHWTSATSHIGWRENSTTKVSCRLGRFYWGCIQLERIRSSKPGIERLQSYVISGISLRSQWALLFNLV